MHPEIVSLMEGMCPECGMALIPVRKKKAAPHAHGNSANGTDYDKHAGHSTNIFKKKFWISFVLTIPIVLNAAVVQEFFGYTAIEFPGKAYIELLVASIIFFYGGWIFISSAGRELHARMPGMMTLIAIAIFTAYAYSVWVTISGDGDALYWELATLITIMLLGHWMEMRAVSGARGALRELSKLLPDTAEVFRGDGTAIVPLSTIALDDRVLVRPGGRIPVDGVVLEGDSEADESLATGESAPVEKHSGSEVIAGTTNGDGSITIRVTKIGASTFLAGVMRLVAEAEASKSRLQLLSDRAAYYLTIIAVATGGTTLFTWVFFAEPSFAVERMVAVLVIACPHALGLAIPLVASISTTKAARNGFLVKRRLALEEARTIGIVLFDKTGTLTQGSFGVVALIPVDGVSEDALLKLSAEVNAHSEHPIAKTIVAEAKQRHIALAEAKAFKRIAGMGTEAIVNGVHYRVGSAALISDAVEIPSAMRQNVAKYEREGKTVVYVLSADRILGAIALADVVRDESKEAVRALHGMGIKTAMITGDAEEVAAWVANEIGIDEYFARVLPEQKSQKVAELQKRGEKVAMVGDGVNDAPALAQADLGIAIGAGTNVAIESAGIILVRNDPRDIPKIIRLSRLTYRKMIQNLFWAAGYNIAAIPLAAGVLAWKGILLQPAVAAVLMSLSTVIVAANAVLLRRQPLT